MPELPDITVYLEALSLRIGGRRLEQVRISSPFLLRTASPPIESVVGRRVLALRRMGKRILIGFEDDLWLVIHLMVSGRLHWFGVEEGRAGTTATGLTQGDRAAARRKASKVAGKNNLAEFRFDSGWLSLTEAGTRKRASLHLVKGEDALKGFDRGGLEVMDTDPHAFAQRLLSENHTLKRALTDPHLFSAIGNAYSDEILHHAQLSPVMLTQKLSPEQIDRLYESVKQILSLWVQRMRTTYAGAFPEEVTAFRPDMAVHGKFGKPCPVCGATVQRIRYADNETNYCPKCQTGGRLLADRSLSLLLKRDWPETAEELEERRCGT